MQSGEVRSRFLKFFESRRHKIIPSASLVPENDPSVLFNTAGMQPLVPYLLGQEHPMGKRLVNVQKCVRTQDIDEVGDNTHDTFFEMMGNWSLGDYWKPESINWSYELLTSKTEGFGLDPQKLYVTCFEGDENAPRDEESAQIWREIFEKNNITGERIYFRPKEKNWWSAGENGPCGPDTEMFYDMTGTLDKGMTLDEYLKADDEQKIVEIWNNVFMEFNQKVKETKIEEYKELKIEGKPIPKDFYLIEKLDKKNVDTGSGLERVVMAVQNKNNIFDTDLFVSMIDIIKSRAKLYDEKSARIVADHIRTSVFLMADGVVPSNSASGYVLRRLIRRAVRHADILGLSQQGDIDLLTLEVRKKYSDIYKELDQDWERNIRFQILQEEYKFRQTLEKGGIIALKKYFNKVFGGIDPDNLPKGMIIKGNSIRIRGEELVNLYQTYGLPIDVSQEIMTDWGVSFDEETMREAKKSIIEHQEKSRTASAGMFKGGLANHNEKTVRLHTAHHLLLAALQTVVDKNIKQRGSNITEERLRLDFSFERKLTDEEKKKVEDWVNDKIAKKLNVVRREMPLGEAEKLGAEMEFGAKYPDVVSVYFIEDENGNAISKEFCGGPHVANTGELGQFKIQKEEAVAQGIRRIKAIRL